MVAPRAVLLSGGLLLACAEGPVTPASAEPFIYVVLNQRTFRPDQRALLVTTGSPAQADFRIAQVFEMRRAADNALFQWLPAAVGTAPACEAICHPLDGNYVLPDTSVGSSLGALALAQPNASYNLQMVTGGITITGQTTVPPVPTPNVIVRNGAKVIVWPRAGVSTYATHFKPLYVARFQSDTEYVVPSTTAPGTYQFELKALDANLARFATDTLAVRAGISRGYGVFGAISVTTIAVSIP